MRDRVVGGRVANAHGAGGTSLKCKEAGDRVSAGNDTNV